MEKNKDPERINRVLSKLRQLWFMYPNMRLCQLMENVGIPPGATHEQHCIFYVEDERFEERLDQWIKGQLPDNYELLPSPQKSTRNTVTEPSSSGAS